MESKPYQNHHLVQRKHADIQPQDDPLGYRKDRRQSSTQNEELFPSNKLPQEQSEQLLQVYLSSFSPSTSDGQPDSFAVNNPKNIRVNDMDLSIEIRPEFHHLPPSTKHPSLPTGRHESPSPTAESRRRPARRTPYSRTDAPRFKSKRVEPHELDALLHKADPSPKPAARRNIRQTQRKAPPKNYVEDDEDQRRSSSRPQTPSPQTSSEDEEPDYQEAVTPPPESSPPPEPKAVMKEPISLALVDSPLYASFDRALIADAQLLLDFHRSAVVH